jgi:cyclopropane-fatty-acyl-phospholipid synthase
MIAQRQSRSSTEYARAALSALRLLLGEEFGRGAIRLWDGTSVGSNQAAFRLLVNTPGALRLALKPPLDLNAGRAFGTGLLDFEGDVEDAIDALLRASSRIDARTALRLASVLRRLPRESFPPMREARLRGRVHSRERDRAAIGFHYDQPLEFFQSFLDRHLVYSCAYYDDGIRTLDEAQDAKLNYILRKVRLRPGERLLDIGCGWGSLVLRAAQNFGAHVLGITLSKSQYEESRRRIARAGLEDRARVELRDYRDLAGERFDKIVSVGMVEHVGRSQLREYFEAAFRALRPGGLFLNHGIADQSPGRKGGRTEGFIEHFVFPDGELVSVSETLELAERSGFEVRDVENLREHYLRTLRAWVHNLEENRARAVAFAGETTYRLWRLYMAGSAQGFRIGRMGLFQSLLARPDGYGETLIPLTRRDLYS